MNESKLESVEVQEFIHIFQNPNTDTCMSTK